MPPKVARTVPCAVCGAPVLTQRASHRDTTCSEVCAAVRLTLIDGTRLVKALVLSNLVERNSPRSSLLLEPYTHPDERGR